MTEKRFNFVGGYLYDNDKCIGHIEDVKFREDFVECLNTLHEENEHYKALFFEIVENALTDKNCKELYCEGILRIFDESNSLNQAREQIKAFLEVEDLE